MQAMLTRGKQQTIDWRGAAGLLVQEGRSKLKNVVHGLRVHLLRLLIRKEMRKIGADDDQRFVSAPQPFKHVGNLFWRRATDGQREQGKIAEYALQERKLNLQRMLLSMNGIADDDLWHVFDGIDRQLIDGYD